MFPILPPEGRCRGGSLHGPPDGNHFPGQEELDALLGDAGFDVVEQIDRPAEVPRSWARRAEEVAAMVEARHRAKGAYALAARQGRRLAGLFAGGHLSMQLIHATRLGRTA